MHCSICIINTLPDMMQKGVGSSMLRMRSGDEQNNFSRSKKLIKKKEAAIVCVCVCVHVERGGENEGKT